MKLGFLGETAVRPCFFKHLHHTHQEREHLRHGSKTIFRSKRHCYFLIKGNAKGVERTKQPFDEDEGTREVFYTENSVKNSSPSSTSYLDFVANFRDEAEIGAILDSLFERSKFQEAFSILDYARLNKLNLPTRVIKVGISITWIQNHTQFFSQSAVDAAIKERNITLLYQGLIWLKRTGLARRFDSRKVSLPKLTSDDVEYDAFSKIAIKNVGTIVPQVASTMKSGRAGFPSGPVMSDTLFGLCFLGFLGVGLSMELINPLILHHEDWEPTMFLLLIFFGLATDRYVGSGKVYRSVERGLRRIFSDDAVRTSRCEAAFLLSGYLLGIPYLFFQPNGDALLRHHRTLLELVDQNQDHPKSLHDTESELFYKYLVWMCSGLAAESAIDGLFFEIDPDKIWRFVEKLDESIWKPFGKR